MSTPAAIGFYEVPGEQHAHVAARPWRGVYHHWEGGLDELGNQLLGIVHKHRGDMLAFVQEMITEAPYGWSTYSEGKKYDDPDDAIPISYKENLGNVMFCYVVDLEAKRLDVFATHADADGELCASAIFDDQGNATRGSGRPAAKTWRYGLYAKKFKTYLCSRIIQAHHKKF